MSLLPFFFGLVLGFFPVLLLLKLFRGRFFVVTNVYFAGALYGFWLWALLLLAFYLDARFKIVGYAASERGVGLIAVLTSSIRGFIAGGVAAALIWKKVFRN
jgi:hypothetical protein